MTEQQHDRRGDEATGVPEDPATLRTRQAQEAHGGSMAPGLVDETGRPVAEPPPTAAGAEDGTRS
ncbi:GTPase activator [Micromonospora okii]|uniref:GTPase activator n=1 Tax=Micromonospora okii TaxID=1182970 RepID=UPI001E33FF9E|nr:GTPase activator [Micromonospora okii]